MIAVFVVFLGIAVMGQDVVRTWEARSHTIEQSRREVENLAWSASQHAETAFRLANTLLSDLVERVKVDGNGLEQLERLRRVMSQWCVSSPMLEDLVLTDADGITMVDGRPVTPRIDLSKREYFQHLRDSSDGQPYYGSAVSSKLTGRLIVPISHRINHADGSFAGIVIATVEVEFFKEFYGTFKLGHDGAAALWRDDGTLLARQAWLPPLRHGNAGDQAPVQYMFPEPQAGTFEVLSHLDGLTKILSYRRLPAFRLVVAVALGKDEQLAAWRGDAVEHLAAAVLVTLALGFVGFRLMMQAQQTAQAERENASVVARTNDSLTHLSGHLTRARDQAEQANRAKSWFLAGMSHGLRTPLNGILGYAQLLHLEGGLNPTQAARVDAMLQAGKHLLEMITCVLDLSEIETNRVTVQAVTFDVRAVAEACLDLIRPAAEAKGLVLRLMVAAETPRQITGDPVRLRQVLLNLLGNAAKFTSQGAIALRLRPVTGEVLRIEVADSGPGIPAEQRRWLFQNSERLDTAATRMAEGAGLGLGLALSARLAVLIGGRLEYEDNPSGGSVFWLELPLGLDAGAVIALEAVSVSEPQGTQPPQRLHVLVVDDVLMNRDIASSFLCAAGHEVTCAEDGAEAVAAVAGADFDVVLMDVRMPRMDGLEATRRIRALGGARGRVPIVALTAQTFADQVVACHEAGMDSHLGKPFDMDTLLAAVAQAADDRPSSTVGTGSTSWPTYKIPEPTIHQQLPVLDPVAYDRTASFLTSEAVAASMQTIKKLGDIVLRGLREPDALLRPNDELADAAHTLAGSAGMFGFVRLATIARKFERAVQAVTGEAPVLAEELCAAVEATMHEMTHQSQVPSAMHANI